MVLLEDSRLLIRCSMSAGKAVLLEVMNYRGDSETSAGFTQTHSAVSQETGIVCPMSGVSSSLSH